MGFPNLVNSKSVIHRYPQIKILGVGAGDTVRGLNLARFVCEVPRRLLHVLPNGPIASPERLPDLSGAHAGLRLYSLLRFDAYEVRVKRP